MSLLEILSKYEPFWLLTILLIEMLAGVYTAYIVRREYDYDFQKDLVKTQRKTRTTKKTTTQPGGSVTTEETNEMTEPMPLTEKSNG